MAFAPSHHASARPSQPCSNPALAQKSRSDRRSCRGKARTRQVTLEEMFGTESKSACAPHSERLNLKRSPMHALMLLLIYGNIAVEFVQHDCQQVPIQCPSGMYMVAF